MKNFFVIVVALVLLLMISSISFAAKVPQHSQKKGFLENSSDREVVGVLIRHVEESEIFYYIFADKEDNLCMDGSITITKNRTISYNVCVSNDGKIIDEHVYLKSKAMKARKTKKEIFCLNEFVRNIFREEYANNYSPPDVVERFNKAFGIGKKEISSP